MSSVLAKYHPRASRYTLNANENYFIRYSGSDRLSWEENTEIKDISMSGLTFITPKDISPTLKEIIKIQFTVPASQQMACHAVVVRIEPIDDFCNQIAVHFYKLDRVRRLNLYQGLVLQPKNHESAQPTVAAKVIAAIGLLLTAICWIILMKTYFL